MIRTTKKAIYVLVLFVLAVILTQYVYREWTINYSDESPIYSQYSNSVLSGDYWEKITMAMNSMFQLAVIAKEWKARMPLPFTSDSFLYGLPTDQAKGADRQNLETIYNIEKLVQLAEKFNLPMFTTFEQFLQKASRSVIVVELKYMYKVRVSHDNLECNTDLLNQLNNVTKKLFLKPFHFVKCCRILAGHNTSPQEMSSLCGIRDMNRVTILISSWRGIEHKARFRLFMKNFNSPYPDPSTPFPHSENVINSSITLLTKKIGTLTKFVGVHLRSEKVWLKSKSFTVFNQCFHLIHNLTQELTVRYSGLPVLYFGDYLTNKVFGKEMKKHNIELVQYSKVTSHDCSDKGPFSGYQSQVQQSNLF